MSLGITSAWRARICQRSCHRGLTLMPRKGQHGGRVAGLDRHASNRAHIPQPSAAIDANAPVLTKRSREDGDLVEFYVYPVWTPRAALRKIGKDKDIRAKHDLEKSVLVKPSVEYSHRLETKRSQNQHHKSLVRQTIYAHQRDQDGCVNTWETILDNLKDYSPGIHNYYEFNLEIAGGFANPTLDMLSGPRTENIWQIVARAGCIIRSDGLNPTDGTLTLSLCGSEQAVRQAMLEVIGLVGKLMATGLTDPDEKEVFGRSINEVHKLLNAEEPAEKTRWQPPVYDYYILTKRADELPEPSKWTASSLEKYVASLVYGVTPHNLNWLYPRREDGLDHDRTVAKILVRVLCSENTRPALSRGSLHMALNFLQSKGIRFRSLPRKVFNQELLHEMPVEVRTWNVLLQGCARSKDLDELGSILKIMTRMGHTPDSYSWVAFLYLVEDHQVRCQILGEMRKRGLDRIPSVLVEIGRLVAVHDLEVALPKLQRIDKFISFQDRLYSRNWLNTMTLNKLLDLLGRHGRIDCGKELLDLVHSSQRLTPDVVTLNTMISRCKGIMQGIEIMKSMRARWESIVPDEVTYHEFFRIAWKRRMPNMLRVIWHYACFTGQANSKIRQRLGHFYHTEKHITKSISFLKSWQEVILGENALKEIQRRKRVTFDGTTIAGFFLNLARMYRPQVYFEDKLAEAYTLDLEITNRTRGGALLTTSDRKSLTVEIPLVKREPEQNAHQLAALEGRRKSELKKRRDEKSRRKSVKEQRMLGKSINEAMSGQ